MGKLAIVPNARVRLVPPTALAAAGTALPAAILALTPLGYWKLNDTSGTSAVDSSGNSRNGTLSGGGLTLGGAVGGDGNNYADFGNGGTGGHYLVADNNVWSLNNASGLTLFALIKPDSVAGTTRQHFMSKGGSGGGAFEWGFHINNGAAARLRHDTWTPAGGGIVQETMDSIVTTAWQAVVCSRDRGDGTSTPSVLYRNSGTALSSTSGPGSNGYVNGVSQVSLGWREDAPSGQFHAGGMAHCAIFAGQLNSTQIGGLMTAAHADGWF